MWDSLFGSPELQIELMLGRVKHTNPKLGVCLVQPLSAPELSGGDTAVSGGTGRLSKAIVKNSEVYRVGEYVLYAKAAMKGTQSSSILPAGVILCRAPVYIKEYDDIDRSEYNKPSSGIFSEFYQLFTVLFDQKASTSSPDAIFATRDWLELKMGGDHLLEGRNVLLRVSDELIQLIGRHCGFHVNSVDSSVELYGVTVAISATGEMRRTTIVNDAILHIERSAGSLYCSYDAKQQLERYSKERIDSDAIYGDVTTLYSSEDTPIYQEQKLYNGLHLIQSATGVVFEKTDGIKAYTPKLASSIQHDKKLKPAPSKDRQAFDRVVDSDNWAIREFDKNHKASHLRSPGDRNSADGGKVKDVSGIELPSYKGTVSWGALPNGGFVIRDAWGSEIRLCDGDIQISAARNIQFIAKQDMVELVGGARSTAANKGVEVNTGAGNIDLHAAKDINMYSSGKADIVADGDVSILTDRGSMLVSAKSSNVILHGGDIHLKATADVTITGARSYVIGTNDALLASTSSVVKCAKALTLANSDIMVLGDMRIGDAEYIVEDIGGVKINCGKGSGTLRTVGSIGAAGNIFGNRALIIKGAGYFGALSTADAKKVEGGYGFSGKLTSAPKETKITPPTADGVHKVQSLTAALEILAAATKASVLTTMFKLKALTVNIIKPIFASADKGSTPVVGNVDIGTESRYIYPGEVFWKSSGVVSRTDKTNGNSIRSEELEAKASTGATDLRL